MPKTTQRIVKPFSSVGVQLMGVILAVAIPLSGMTGYLWFKAVEENREIAADRLRQAADSIAADLRSLQRQSASMLSALAESPSIRTLDPRGCDQEANLLRRLHPEYFNVIVWDAAGRLICSAAPLSRSAVAAARNRTAFVAGMKSSGLHVSDVFFGQISKQYRILFTYPIRNLEGEAIGLLSVPVELRYFDRLISQLNLPPGSIAAILDGSDTIVARMPGAEEWRGRSGKNAPVSRVAQTLHRSAKEVEGVDGVDRMYVGFPVTDTNWKVFAGMPSDVLFSRHRVWLFWGILTTCAVVLASALLAYRIALRVRKPLEALAVTAEAVAGGNRTARATDAGSAEVRRVAGQFNRMLDSIVESEASLQKTNRRLQHLSSRLLREREDERGAIARELHDQIGQDLTALELELKYLPHDATVKRASVSRCIEIVAQLLEQVRGLSLDLRPSQLDDLGLVAALRAHVDRHFRDARIDVELVADDVGARLTRDLETVCFRICQEALTNVLRHAAARSISITLRAVDNELRLTVCDDGAGFDPDAALRDAASGHSSGLPNMIDRANLADGSLSIRSSPGTGTLIEVRLPLSDTNQTSADNS